AAWQPALSRAGKRHQQAEYSTASRRSRNSAQGIGLEETSVVWPLVWDLLGPDVLRSPSGPRPGDDTRRQRASRFWPPASSRLGQIDASTAEGIAGANGCDSKSRKRSRIAGGFEGRYR